MNSLKNKNMMAAFNGFHGSVVISEIMSRIPAELLERLTGREIGLVMSAMNASYHAGRAATGAEVIDSTVDDGAVWVNCLNRAIAWKDDQSGDVISEDRPGCRITRRLPGKLIVEWAD